MEEQRRRIRQRRTHARLWPDLALLSVIGLVLVAALGAGGVSAYHEFYSPTAFVRNYLNLLATGRAADAMRLPGVALDRSALGEAGIPSDASDALLRQTALTSLTDIAFDQERTEGADTLVTTRYRAGGHQGTTTFRIRQGGWIGVAPTWRFTQSPLSVLSLTLRGSEQFTVNGFELDRRQVAPQSPPLQPVPMLVFSPGLYAVSVDTAISSTTGTSVLADAPAVSVPLDVQATPTQAFVDVVQQRVDSFLNQCTAQQVLQPTACPFGMAVHNRITEAPTWTMVEMPAVRVEPDGEDWSIPPTPATAHLTVTVQSLFDGSIHQIDEDIPFLIEGTITVLADGSASINIGSPGGSAGSDQS